MILILLTFLFLIIINLVLLKFSCNKMEKRVKTSSKSIIFKNKITSEEDQETLAKTGS